MRPSVAASVSALAGSAAPDQTAALVQILLACVRSGAAVGYLRDLDEPTALSYWRGTLEAASAGQRIVLVAKDRDGVIAGTVQLSLHFPPNQWHVGGVSMLLVHPRCRRQGVARSLINALEGVSRKLGRTLLILQTTRGSAAEHLYLDGHYQTAGIIPGFAVDPDGTTQDGVFYWKRLQP